MNRKRKIERMRKFIKQYGEIKTEYSRPKDEYYPKGSYYVVFDSKELGLVCGIGHIDKYHVYKKIVKRINQELSLLNFDDFYKMIKKLSPGDNIKIASYDNIRLRQFNDGKIISLKSPFSSKEQYENFCSSYFGITTKPITIKLDKIHHIRAVRLCDVLFPDFTDANYYVSIRKLWSSHA